METSDYIEGGFILLSRKLNNNDSSFQYCRNNDHKWMFIMSLMMANYEDKVWKGIEIRRGQFVTSRKHFADVSHTKEQQVRDFWKNMEKARFLTTKTTNRHTLITICNYDRYQNLTNYIKEKQPTENPTKNQQRTTTKEYKRNEKEINRENPSDFEKALGIRIEEVIKTID